MQCYHKGQNSVVKNDNDDIMILVVSKTFSNDTNNINNGYPGGCATPNIHPSAISSPESPPIYYNKIYHKL